MVNLWDCNCSNLQFPNTWSFCHSKWQSVSRQRIKSGYYAYPTSILLQGKITKFRIQIYARIKKEHVYSHCLLFLVVRNSTAQNKDVCVFFKFCSNIIIWTQRQPITDHYDYNENRHRTEHRHLKIMTKVNTGYLTIIPVFELNAQLTFLKSHLFHYLLLTFYTLKPITSVLNNVHSNF
jgi:hypothetical protein